MDSYLYFIILYTTTVYAGTVQKIDILNSQAAIKGTSIKLACYISQFSSQDLLSIHKTNSSLLTGVLPGTSLTQCIPSTCFRTTDGRNTFSADSGHVYIDIPNLKRSEDQKWWTCVLDTQRKDMYLTIYTVPQILQFVSPPNQDQDLAENTVTLRCSTGCTYPQPSFKWFYTEAGGSLTEWWTSGTDSDTTGGCTDSERIYTSTLSLGRYSTFPGNLDKTVKFTCGIPTFTGMTQPLYTNQSVDIQFAVQVNNVILKDGETILVESLYVIGGDSKTLTCTTSFSRPTPTVVWYIGTVERQRSNSNSTFTFIPNNSDNGKQLYCKAFNLQPENEAIVSNKATLNVIDTHLSQDFYIEGHLTQKNVTVDEHDADILFKCIVNSYPQFNIKIVFDGNVLKEQTNESSLLFYRNDVSCFDAGVYTCEGSNIFGRKSIKNITLFVQCPPRPFRNVKRNITSYLYSVVTLGVTVVAYPEPGTKGFAWYKEESIGWFQMLSNADLLITSSGLQSNLTLFNVSKEDYGHYKVIVTNSKGTYEQHIFLSEEMVSDVQEAEGDCSCQTSDKTALIVGLTLGVLCCIVTTYAAYVTISRNKLLREGTKQLRSSSKQVSYANANFASDVTERERYDGDASIQQYTDLTRYTDTDLNTYDVINKM